MDFCQVPDYFWVTTCQRQGAIIYNLQVQQFVDATRGGVVNLGPSEVQVDDSIARNGTKRAQRVGGRIALRRAALYMTIAILADDVTIVGILNDGALIVPMLMLGYSLALNQEGAAETKDQFAISEQCEPDAAGQKPGGNSAGRLRENLNFAGCGCGPDVKNAEPHHIVALNLGKSGQRSHRWIEPEHYSWSAVWIWTVPTTEFASRRRKTIPEPKQRSTKAKDCTQKLTPMRLEQRFRRPTLKVAAKK